MSGVSYLKSVALGLLAGVATIAIQTAMFGRLEYSDGGSSGAVMLPTRMYFIPVVIAVLVGSLAAWARRRGRNVAPHRW